MTKYVDKIVAAFKREPVRVRVYGVLVLVVAYLAAKGYVDDVTRELILGVAATVLVVERTRAHTVPVVKGSRKR